MLIDSLIVISGESSFGSGMADKIKDIKTEFSNLSRDQFGLNKDQIVFNLLIEFGVYTKGNREKYKILNTNDEQLKKAVGILKDIEQYRKILGYR
jgi:hypothetical protein